MAYVELERHPAGRSYLTIDDVFIKFEPTKYKLKKQGGLYGWTLILRFSKAFEGKCDIFEDDYISFHYDENDFRDWRIEKYKGHRSGYQISKSKGHFFEVKLRWPLFNPNIQDIEGFVPNWDLKNDVLFIRASPKSKT